MNQYTLLRIKERLNKELYDSLKKLYRNIRNNGKRRNKTRSIKS